MCLALWGRRRIISAWQAFIESWVLSLTSSLREMTQMRIICLRAAFLFHCLSIFGCIVGEAKKWRTAKARLRRMEVYLLCGWGKSAQWLGETLLHWLIHMSKPKAAKVTHPKTLQLLWYAYKNGLHTHTNAQNAHTLLREHEHTTQKQCKDLHLKSYSRYLSARMGK